MHPLEELFLEIKKNWDKLGNPIDRFPDLAFQHLLNFNWLFDHQDFYKLLDSIGPLPLQTFPGREFGELPFTVYRDEKFIIDIYIWNSFETSIHDHHFCGAFKVIQGRSLHQVYEFEEKKKINSLIQYGELKRIKTENLTVGSAQKIELADKFIHQVCHLGAPTVTLCVRTNNLFDNLFSYHTSGFRFKYNLNTSKVAKYLDYIDCLFNSKDRSEEFLKKEIFEIFRSFELIEIMACVNKNRLDLSSKIEHFLHAYIRENNLFPWLDFHLECLAAEQKFQKKLMFLKRV